MNETDSDSQWHFLVLYVVILSAALDLVATVPKGVVLFCNIAPSLVFSSRPALPVTESSPRWRKLVGPIS
jgi:hypothetical protein